MDPHSCVRSSVETRRIRYHMSSARRAMYLTVLTLRSHVVAAGNSFWFGWRHDHAELFEIPIHLE